MKLPVACEIEACPAITTPHAHLPKELREWRPDNSLEVSAEAEELAEMIRNSYDGLTFEQRKSSEAHYLGWLAVKEIEEAMTVV